MKYIENFMIRISQNIFGRCEQYHSVLKCKKERLNHPGWGLKMLLEIFGLLNRF